MSFTGMQYNPNGDGVAAVDKAAGNTQMQAFYWLKKAIIESRKEQYFSQLASTIGMPKHFGKTIKVHEYVPLLDERNVNDQGIDAAGAVLDSTQWSAFDENGAVIDTTYASEALAWAAAGATGSVLKNSGNLYGSSKDIGTITGKLPLLSETGGRVNRVGFTRLEREGSINKFGFFYEFTKESLDFDSDAELNSHLSRELMTGAVQLTEAVLQKDLLSAAGVVVYAGAAVSNNTVTGEGADVGDRSLVTYEDLQRLSQTLTDNRTPKQTKVIAGSRLQDTKTIPASRILFIGSELKPVIKAMTDLHGNEAFIPVQKYADAANVLNGEIGSVDEFRIIEVPEMLHWSNGADVVTEGANGYRTSGSGGAAGDERYNVYPMLCIGDDAFTTIGFQTDGKSAKFSVITKMPGNETADRNDPFGETGFSSIKWYYGTLFKRPERIGLIKTIAPV